MSEDWGGEQPSIQDYAAFFNEEVISTLEEEGELSSEVANDIRSLLTEFREPEDLRNLGEHLERRIRSEERQEEFDTTEFDEDVDEDEE